MFRKNISSGRREKLLYFRKCKTKSVRSGWYFWHAPLHLDHIFSIFGSIQIEPQNQNSFFNIFFFYFVLGLSWSQRSWGNDCDTNVQCIWKCILQMCFFCILQMYLLSVFCVFCTVFCLRLVVESAKLRKCSWHKCQMLPGMKLRLFLLTGKTFWMFIKYL